MSGEPAADLLSSRDFQVPHALGSDGGIHVPERAPAGITFSCLKCCGRVSLSHRRSVCFVHHPGADCDHHDRTHAIARELLAQELRRAAAGKRTIAFAITCFSCSTTRPLPVELTGMTVETRRPLPNAGELDVAVIAGDSVVMGIQVRVIGRSAPTPATHLPRPWMEVDGRELAGRDLGLEDPLLIPVVRGMIEIDGTAQDLACPVCAQRAAEAKVAAAKRAEEEGEKRKRDYIALRRAATERVAGRFRQQRGLVLATSVCTVCGDRRRVVVPPGRFREVATPGEHWDVVLLREADEIALAIALVGGEFDPRPRRQSAVAPYNWIYVPYDAVMLADGSINTCERQLRSDGHCPTCAEKEHQAELAREVAAAVSAQQAEAARKAAAAANEARRRAAAAERCEVLIADGRLQLTNAHAHAMRAVEGAGTEAELDPIIPAFRKQVAAILTPLQADADHQVATASGTLRYPADRHELEIAGAVMQKRTRFHQQAVAAALADMTARMSALFESTKQRLEAQTSDADLAHLYIVYHQDHGLLMAEAMSTPLLASQLDAITAQATREEKTIHALVSEMPARIVAARQLAEQRAREAALLDRLLEAWQVHVLATTQGHAAELIISEERLRGAAFSLKQKIPAWMAPVIEHINRPLLRRASESELKSVVLLAEGLRLTEAGASPDADTPGTTT